MNGVPMNKFFNGRPQWSNWGGLNDLMRNQEFNAGLQTSDYGFGGLIGSTNINTKASSYRSGGRVTYSSSNRSYANRVLVSYASGLNTKGWAYALQCPTDGESQAIPMGLSMTPNPLCFLLKSARKTEFKSYVDCNSESQR